MGDIIRHKVSEDKMSAQVFFERISCASKEKNWKGDEFVRGQIIECNWLGASHRAIYNPEVKLKYLREIEAIFILKN